MMTPIRLSLTAACSLAVACCLPAALLAQSVGLPAPRLLTTMPMGGQAGTQIEVTISGENLEDADQLAFSDPRITAAPKLDAAGKPLANKYQVTIAADCPPGVYEARVMSRLGMSSSRIFSVGALPEVSQSAKNTSLATAMELAINSVCNAVLTEKQVDYYQFAGRKGQRIVVQCSAKGIDSNTQAVLIIADAAGRDLLVERRGGALDFTVADDGKYVIKVHGLTFQGGADNFYRLILTEVPVGAPIPAVPSTMPVNSFSWPPTGLAEQASMNESEPNHESGKAQQISLPCDIAGNFFPAADVDVFEFEAKKGEVWWVEVASERFDLLTDPAILVQHVAGEGESEKRTDVAEFSDIPSPVKVSSNGYAYDGPPYNAGSADILGKLEIKQDGKHRLQLTDLFGGTRNDPHNIYRLVIRKAAPEYALVAWALHMELRNGDRNALSKPIALRGGATMALEVVAIRRDGFDGDIELAMENLPDGVRAQGLKIPAGQSRGIMLVTADEKAPRALARATFVGRAKVGEEMVTRSCRLATMAWPVRDAWSEIPKPRLLADVPVSVSGFEVAPFTIAPAKREVWEATVGTKLTIPLVHTRRSDFSGATMTMKSFGAGFEKVPALKVTFAADSTDLVLDLAALKTPPGDYLIALYGGAVAKYRHYPEAIVLAEAAKSKAEQELMALEAEAKRLAEEAKTASVEQKGEADRAAAEAAAKQKAAAAAVAAATEQVKKATAAAAPKDIADIVVSEPIAIRIKPAETK
jgi:hypothetical protein